MFEVKKSLRSPLKFCDSAVLQSFWHTPERFVMSETESLPVQLREQTGSAASRRLRKEGHVPAVLYGHGEGNQHLTASHRDVKTVLRHHSKTVQLTGGSDETALIADVHYDPLGIDVLHLDLIRVNLKEKVEVTVPIHTKGESEGVAAGGIILQTLHEVDIRCPAGNIPESLDVDVTSLKLGDTMSAGDLQLPSDVELITEADISIVRVEEPKAVESDETETPATGEPEVINEKGKEDSEGEASDD